MRYLSDGDYDAIRADPTRLAAIYATVKADFAVDLGFDGLSDDALAAAFCTVVAYDMAAYGESPQTYDLPTLLSSQTLSCAHYVAVAWQFMELLGIDTTQQVAVGWDGGAIGNHAQMLFSDGVSNLLLDPTIALIVNGVTYEGLITQTPYTQMTSFYHWNDIDQFEATVRDAIANGLVHVRDTIYSVPSLFEWMTNQSSYQGIVIDLAFGKLIVGYLGDDVLDAGAGDDTVYGGKGNDILWLGDGDDLGYGGIGDDIVDGGEGDDAIDGGDGDDRLRGQNGNDILDGGEGDDAIEGGDGADRLLGGDGNDALDGGLGDDVVDGGGGFDRAYFSGSLYDYAMVDFGDGTARVRGADGDDRLVGVEEIVFDDYAMSLTARKETEFDTDDAFSWNAITHRYDALDRKLGTVYENDDRSEVRYNDDALAQFSWNFIVDYLDTQSNRLKVIYYNDNDSLVSYEYDTLDNFDWARIETRLDADGNPEKIVYTQDDEIRYTYLINHEQQNDWNNIFQTHDRDLQKISEFYSMNDGTSVLYNYDTYSLNDWTRTARYYDSEMRVVQDVSTGDDGVYTVIDFDVETGGVSQIARYDSAWHLLI